MTMKRMTIVWGIVMVLIFASLTTFGFLYTKRRKEYEKLEIKLLEVGRKYGDEKFSYQEVDKDIKIQLKDLIEEKYLDELKVKDDVCDGYVVLSKGVASFEYNAYIKCEKYVTVGY